METRYKRIRLPLDPFIESIVRHQVNIPEFISVIYFYFCAAWDEIDVLCLASHFVLVIYAEIKA
jgi:hypothetical protein